MPKSVDSFKFPQMKPAHHAFIQSSGEGSNFDRAVRDGILQIFKDKRLKGKKARNLSPVTFTVVLIAPELSEEDGR